MASNSEGGPRKLAAIMFTDVKDFSKKMGENEIAAMEVLKIHDDTMREIVAKHNGIVIKSLGDSFMVDFSSAVNAVRCAVETQERFWEHNKGKTDFEKIQIRIGIHLGDVITIGNDLYGDGVNIAARIEAITEPNRICVSAEIYNQVKNKMPIRAYNIGSTDLKNIAEPVEVLELLLDSIPELSTPSESAKQIPTRRRADLISSQEEEEAKRVEVARQKVDDEKEREEGEKKRQADEHFAKAEQYFRAGNLAKAEEEVKEIYKVVQIHYEAQMLILQIEEQRAQRDEEDRRRRVKEEKQRKEDERKQRIQDCLDTALQFIEHEQYPEALNALQEVYILEPNNEQAKRIEKQVQFAEEARQERQRLEALAEEERAREETQRLERQRAEDLAAAALEKAAMQKEKEKKKPRIKLYIGLGAIAVLLVGVVLALLLTHGPLNKPTGIAVLPFTTSQADNTFVGEAFSVFVADELAKIPDMTTISPTSARAVAANSSNFPALASSLGITHVVRGSLALDGTSVTLKAEIIDLSEGKAVAEASLQGSVVDLNNLAAQLTARMFKSLDIEISPQAPPRLTQNAEALIPYLRGLALLNKPSSEAIRQSEVFFQESLQKDSTFPAAKAGLSYALLDWFELTGEHDEPILVQASNLAHEAIAADPNSPFAHLVLGEAYLRGQQFTKAHDEITRTLALEPGNAECQRELARLSLIQGSADEALEYASAAMKTDPKYFDSYVVKGIAQLFKSQYEDATRLFDQASALGASDSLLTVNYKMRAWIGADKVQNVVTFCQRMMDRADDRTKVILYYWLGRAYQLSGKMESVATLDQGIQLADRVYAQNPGDYTTLAYYALLQARRGANRESSVRLMEHAVAFDSTSSRVHYWKARLYAIQNDKAKAFSELAKAISIRYSFPRVLDPDFLSIWGDPQFASTISLKTQANGTGQ